MQRKITLVFIVISLFLIFSSQKPAFCSSQSVEYLCELGLSFYHLGKYEDALTEFNKALILDPDNQTAKKYVNSIFSDLNPEVKGQEVPIIKKEDLIQKEPAEPVVKAQEPLKQEIAIIEKKPTREEAMNSALADFGKSEFDQKSGKKEGIRIGGIKVSGETQLRMGFTPEDAIWKRANWDLNEKNFRMLSNTAFDRKENTFDTRIYDRLKVNLDTDQKEGLNFHSNITVDPWSFTGKSDKFTVTSAFGDQAEIELKYWSNTGYTLNETINTLRLGNSFSLPEVKVQNGKVDGFQVSGAFTPNDTFSIPQTKIYREFQPVRELWFDYKQDDVLVRFFPIAYENQALTFDDPLQLSNKRIWWEDSPWIRRWTHGINNSGATPADFTKGFWDKSNSFTIRDSEGQRLTALRGLSFNYSPIEGTSLASSFATPKDLWQEYSDVDNIISATRAKHLITDNLSLGATYTTRLGFNVDRKEKTDSKNYVASTDLNYEVIEGVMTSLEVARSQSYYDLTDPQYKTKSRGNAYYFSLMGRYPQESILNTQYGYNGIQPGENERFFNKFRFFFSRMDDSFDQPLSSYVETRDDEFWGRHLHFRQPFKYYYQGEGQDFGWDNIKSYKVGDGIDVGRNTLGLRIESLLWDKKVDNLFDVRNVHDVNGKFVENVSRDELTWRVNNKLTSKALGIYQKMPLTKGGTDPFVFNTTTRRYFDNSYIDDGQDPSLKTGSLGLEYAFFDWLALNGIWEYTNDYSLGYDNFPRGIFNSSQRSDTFYEDYNRYRGIRDFLYNQAFFPKPPYPYYNIFKSGLRLDPFKDLEFYLDYTRNSYEKAGQVDDNMNHVGFEVSYTPTKKIGIFLKYTYSRWQDLDALSNGVTKVFGHHNLFSEFIYRISKDEDFTFQYGEASRDPYMGGVLDIGWDPYGGSLRTIDTQHIFRLYYRRKF